MEKGKLRSLLSISMSTAIQEEQEKMSSFSFSLEEEARLAQSASVRPSVQEIWSSILRSDVKSLFRLLSFPFSFK